MEVPFIGDFLAFILFLVLIYITLYALYLRFNPPKPIPASQWQIQAKIPIPTQKPTYPTNKNDTLPSIFQNSNSELLDLSIVIVLEPIFNPYHICQSYKDIYKLFDDILNYFHNRDISYEVILVTNNINSNNINYQDIREFTLQNPEFKIFNITVNTLNRAWQVTSIHTRGRLIFNFSPYEEIPFDVITKYIIKAQSGKKYGDEVVVIGSWKPRTNDEIYKTNLSIFSDCVLNYLMSFIDMKPSGYHHCFSFMMTREAAILILSNLSKFNSFYFSETLMIADALKMTIKVLRLDQTDDAVIERPSLNKIDEILTFSLSLIMYKLKYWNISRIPNRYK